MPRGRVQPDRTDLQVEPKLVRPVGSSRLGTCPPASKCPQLLSWGLSPPQTHIHLEAQNDFIWKSGLCRRNQSRVILDLGWILSLGFRTCVL